MRRGALRQLWDGRVFSAGAYGVVEERDHLLAHWIPPGTPSKRAFSRDGRRLEIPESDWELRDVPWRHDALRLTRPGARHSVILFWRNGAFHHWYVNFERPLTPSPVGFDYLDEKLDLVVPLDGEPYLHDEDELELAVAAGMFTPAEADEVRAEARRVLADPPWPTGWEDWRPDPSWPVPQLPEGWDVV